MILKNRLNGPAPSITAASSSSTGTEITKLRMVNTQNGIIALVNTNYAKALYGLSVPGEAICETGRIFKNTPEIGKMLENPLVSLKEKEQVIERVFPQEMKSFLKVTCKYQKIDRIGEILEAYDAYSREQKGILKAELLYVTRPAEEQENKMKEFLRSQFSAREVELTLTEDKSLVGGFVLRAGDREYDWSLIGRYKKLKQKLTRR